MTPEQERYRDLWLSELWAPVRELDAGQRARQRLNAQGMHQPRPEPAPAERCA